MSAAKHTPAPWEAILREDGADWDVREAGDGSYIATVPNPYSHLGDRDDLVEDAATETEDNARLIAAAPDLLRVLGVLREKWEGDAWVTDQQEMLELTRAAIAKATGETGQ